MEKLVLIDGHSIMNRAFYGMPDLTNSAGVHTGAVYGFLNILFRILDEEKPEYLAVAFDVHAPTFRHKVYPAYKGTRHPMPEELNEQIPIMKEVLQAMQIPIYEQEGLEADDILGTLAKKAQAQGMEAVIVSGDRDLLQICDERIMVRMPKTKKGETTVENYTPEDVRQVYHVTPKEYIEVKALQGDASDNVPGVPKVGPKTATRLIETYHSVDGVYVHLEEISKKSLHDTLKENEEQARLSLFLVTIKTDADVTLDQEKARIDLSSSHSSFYNKESFRLFTELGFRNYLSRFDSSFGQDEEKDSVLLWDESSWDVLMQSSREEGKAIGIFLVADPVPGSSTGEQSLVGAAFSDGKNAFWFPVNKEEEGQKLTSLFVQFRKSGKMLSVFDIKSQFSFWGIEEDEFQDGIHLDSFFDVLLGAYLINPLKSDYEPEDVASEYLGETITGEKQFLGKKTYREKWNEENELSFVQNQDHEKSGQTVEDYAAKTAKTLSLEAPVIKQKLKEEGMLSLYETVELPLSYILYDMQKLGIRVIREKLKEYGKQLTGRIEELRNTIYEEAGHEFNIASPKQLGHVLFEELHLPYGKKTKTGYSTAADVLEKLAPDYPIVDHILEYRALTKLKSTYADGLETCIARDSRIHTTFHQTITATGRISSTEPNLQNIPMRTDLGRTIRKVFVPEDGWSFVDADYSQIELRILASMSNDEALIEAYRENRDIHRTTASKVFHTPYDKVTDQQRRNAKAVNFGIVYGISSFGLSQNLSISREEAKDYIESYFHMFPGVKKFLDEEVSLAKERGYSVTMFGRRRPIPELKSSQYMQRQFGERVAMNAPIQGTGADIMKIAMIRVWEELHRRKLSSRMILQIHDELLIETAKGEEEEVKKIVEEGMKGAAHLTVPLEVDVHEGSDWYEAK